MNKLIICIILVFITVFLTYSCSPQSVSANKYSADVYGYKVVKIFSNSCIVTEFSSL